MTADEVYGQDPALRAELARRGLGYVLAIPKRHLVITGIGARTAIELARLLPARAWQRLSAGPGAKGPRWYDWALIEAADPAVTTGGGPHWLLIRRSISDGEYAFYRAHAPGPVPLGQLDEHQVRSWTSRHRWTILALLAHAFLAVLAAAQADAPNPDDDQLIPRRELTSTNFRR